MCCWLPSQCIKGAELEEDGQPVLYTLNNRRMYLFKWLQREGIIDQVTVRRRGPKSNETERYSIANCALEAKLMKARGTSAAAHMASAVGDDSA